MGTDQIDPHHKWLGIHPDEQPADYYRLLGVVRFESDSDVIENAADRQMVFVRQFQQGPHAELAAELLNEIAAARICLLSVAQRLAYDRQLPKMGRLGPPPPITLAQVEQEQAAIPLAELVEEPVEATVVDNPFALPTPDSREFQRIEKQITSRADKISKYLWVFFTGKRRQ